MNKPISPNNLILSAEIALKWKYYRDTHFSLYEVTNDVEGYEQSIAWYKLMLKELMSLRYWSIIEAVNHACKQADDARLKLKYICAGYDLATAVEQTCQKNTNDTNTFEQVLKCKCVIPTKMQYGSIRQDGKVICFRCKRPIY